MTTALITGVSGQDGFYLAKHLLAQGQSVVGMVRGRPVRREDLAAELPGLALIEGDLQDQSSLMQVLDMTQPDVIYNLGALTFVGRSWSQPGLMTDVTGLGLLRLVEAMRIVCPAARLVQASSSEMFGAVRETPQDELTPLNPRSPYGVAKAFAHHTAVNYRDSYSLSISTAIMFNHESPRRGIEFVTQKIVRAAVAHGNEMDARRRREMPKLRLGNIGAQRDWGWAPEFVKALHLIAEYDEPTDFVIATGRSHPVSDLLHEAYRWAGGLDWRPYVEPEQAEFMRPADVELLRGDARKAKRLLGWEPEWTFDMIVKEMVEAERKRVADGR